MVQFMYLINDNNGNDTITKNVIYDSNENNNSNDNNSAMSLLSNYQ